MDNQLLSPSLETTNKINFRLNSALLIEQALLRNEGVLGTNGEIICDSGKFKGRSPKDKFIVAREPSEKNIWWGPVNQKISEASFNTLHANVKKFLADKELFVYDGFAGANPNYRLKVRIVTTKAWHCLFVNNMFIEATGDELKNFTPDYTILNACEYKESNWKKLGLNSENFVAFDLENKLSLIGGTEYAGEMKKGIFSVMNYLLPLKGVMAMHCSATMGAKNDVAIFFGLSGTGKTTLSADATRHLIGDDEHGWADDGVFNFEGGCYAKTLKLTKEQEPEIWNAIKFGSLLENVKFNPETRLVDFFDDSLTQNGRVSYPLKFIPNINTNGMGGHPKYIFMLTCDAFGVLPPIAKLSPEQASYHFLNGYTSKVAGTEDGVTEPTATFSTCFGQPFMTLSPKVYSDLLAKKMQQHNTKVFLINTGWIGGKTGSRIKLKYTRAIINNTLNGTLDTAKYVKDPVFGFLIPESMPDIPADVLNPKDSWKNKSEYDAEYKKLATMFINNFEKMHKNYASDLINAGPTIK